MKKYPYNLDEYNIQERRIATNGIELNVFEAGSGPLVFLLHGFPECWASWGPQITYLLDRGYHVVVPEMRGYGESDAPAAVTAYDTVDLAADVAGLIEAYGAEPALVIGHDWGCIVAWHVAWLHPEKLGGIGGLSVPWFGRGEMTTLDLIASLYPDDYFYITDFQRPETTELFDRDPRETLTRVMLGNMAMLGQPADERNFLQRIDMPDTPVNFMPQDFIEYLVSRYRFHGFEPPLNWYRNFQRTFERTAGRADDVIAVPAMYLTGTDEWTVELARSLGMDELAMFSDLRVTGLADAGHWLGQERPEWVNGKIDEFLQSIDY
jgi:pimeloyl-ACP methyl ester carboxylesterase